MGRDKGSVVPEWVKILAIYIGSVAVVGIAVEVSLWIVLGPIAVYVLYNFLTT